MLLQEKNSGFIDFKTINDIMIGRHHSKTLELLPSDITCIKYALITSVDMHKCWYKRSLAVLKICRDLLGEIQHSITEKKLQIFNATQIFSFIFRYLKHIFYKLCFHIHVNIFVFSLLINPFPSDEERVS